VSSRDVVAGVLVALAVVVWVVGGVAEVFLSTRATALAVVVLGLAACLVGGWWMRPMLGDPAVMRPLAALGVLAALAAGATLVTGSLATLLVLVLLTAALWGAGDGAPRECPPALRGGTMPEDDTRRRVVEALDESTAARHALRHAIRDARERGADLEVVTALVSPERWAVLYRVPFVVDRESAHASALATARAVVEEVLAGDAVEHPGLPAPAVDVRVEFGDPGPVLAERARGAEVLVLGHRGRGATGTVVLGSVGWWCLRHAPCPVSVVPPPVGARDVRVPAARGASSTS
jgi:nucleotide-binding universal stress UspA family protein